MARIGVLSFQGSVEEHMNAVAKCGHTGVLVKRTSELDTVDALIMPGGESTTISRLLNIFGMTEPLKQRIQSGMPVWGTCAGMILLAKQIEEQEPYLGLMDMKVRRNAYGRQSDSFETSAVIEEISENPLPLVFIRAPWVSEVYGEARVLCKVEGHIAAVRQGNMLATSFHPELTDDLSVLDYFTGMCR